MAKATQKNDEQKIDEQTVAVPKKEAQKVTIDGREYALDSLNETARTQLVNLRMADQRIAHLQADLSMTQTARSVYAKLLAENLPKE